MMEKKNGVATNTTEPVMHKEAFSNFEDILRKIGPFGTFQIALFILVNLSDIISSVSLQFFIFGAANPGYVCLADDNLSIDDVIKNGTFVAPSINDTSYSINKCDVNGIPCISRIYKPDFTSIITEWDLVCERGYYPTIITTLLMVGMGVGAAFFGHAGDWWGRQPAFYSVITFLVFAEFIQSYSNSWQMMAACRFLVGSFTGGALVLASIYPIEFIGKSYRSIVGCLGLWGVGTFTLVLLAYFIKDWRHLSMATALIGVLYPLTSFFVPESVRWLLQKKKTDQAHMVFRKIASTNKKVCPTKELLVELAKSPEFCSPGKQKYSYKDLVTDAALRPRTLLMWYLWFALSMMYYGVVLDVRDVSDDRYANIAIMAAVDYVFSLSVVYTAYRFGRRLSLLGYMIITTIGMITVMVLDLAKVSAVVGRTIISIIGRGGVSASWGIGYLLSAELFPTSMRNIGASGCSVAGRIGGALAPQIAYLRNYHTSIPYIIFSALSVVGAVLIFKFLPETKGVPLPDNVHNIEKASNLVDNANTKDSQNGNIKDNQQNGHVFVVTKF